jgi:hypothetical protein
MNSILRYCFALILFLNSLNCVAQKHRRQLRLIEAPWDSVIQAPVIPDNIFSQKIDGFVMGTQRVSKVENQKATFLKIYWSAPSIDGDYFFMITKKQVILTSGHENPNPNFLFWFTDINEKQYEEIVDMLDRSKASFSEHSKHRLYGRELNYKNYSPERYKKKIGKYESHLYIIAQNLIAFFNKGLMPTEQLVFPTKEEFAKIRPLVTATNSSEITDFIIKYDGE